MIHCLLCIYVYVPYCCSVLGESQSNWNFDFFFEKPIFSTEDRLSIESRECSESQHGFSVKKKSPTLKMMRGLSSLVLIVTFTLTGSTPLSHFNQNFEPKSLQQRFSTVPVAPSTVALDNLQIASTNSLDVYVTFFLNFSLSSSFTSRSQCHYIRERWC